MLGLPFLAALGFSKHFNMSLVISSLIHILGLLIIIPFINVYLIVIMTIITQALILSIRLYGVKKYNLWSISNDNLHI
jgi:PST family polysaccharide transporter